MISIALISALGGTGRSSLSVGMAHLLTRLGRTVRLLELCPSNALPFILGMNERPTQGIGQALLEDPVPPTPTLVHPHGFDAHAFGHLNDAGLLTLHQRCMHQPKPIQLGLNANKASKHIQLLDMPAWPSPIYQPVMPLTDLNIVILTPDPLSIISIEPMLPMLQHSRGVTYFLMNRFDSSKVLHLDIWTLCKTKLGHRLLPFYLHDDQAQPESLASGQPLFEYAPQAQLLEDQHKLCNWIDAEIQ